MAGRAVDAATFTSTRSDVIKVPSPDVPLAKWAKLSVVSWSSVASGPIGTTGSVVKIRLPASSSTATPVNDSPAGTVQRTDPTKSVVSVSVNSSSMNWASWPLALNV